MKYIVVLCALMCTTAFAKSKPEILNNKQIVSTKSTAQIDAEKKKNGRGKIESHKNKKKKKGNDKKNTSK
jgi:hypothetical protein